MRARWLGGIVIALATAGFLACGSRTGLPFDEEVVGTTAEAGGDGTRPRLDGGDEDIPDSLPPIETGPKPDVDRSDCPDAAATLIYVVTDTNELLSFYPPTATFKRIGVLACPAPGASPFSMAVDRRGVAYVLFRENNGTRAAGLFRVSTATAACAPTTFVNGQSGFETFGMGFAANNGGPAETLYVASDEGTTTNPTSRLAKIDTTTFKLNPVGSFVPQISRAELTGTGAGDLYAFYSDVGSADSFIGQIDKTTAQVVAEDRLAGVNQGQGWAFAFWGGDFWLFTAPSSGSRVTRFQPATKTVSFITNYTGIIVGAGVSTCAPQ